MITIENHTEAELDTRMEQRVWVVIDDETREALTTPMTYNEASLWIHNESMNPRPNAVKGWMYIKEVDVETFTDEQEELFAEMDEALVEHRGAKLSLDGRGCGVPDWRVEQLVDAVNRAKERYTAVTERVLTSEEDSRAYPRWRRIHRPH